MAYITYLVSPSTVVGWLKVDGTLTTDAVPGPGARDGHRPDRTPWITQALAAASISSDYVPPNVICVGPLILPCPPTAEQDPALAAWLQRGGNDGAGTVLFNLSTIMAYD
ncbi:2-hydroxyacylsphingosine 1-beta-galactosyltransferase [Apiospora phragmitis]|uniref:2-hydroxyacylsphingosine 1-beta-galactosyltransferase n=1 Tax=Apiospora phragmitis TaxID=2905665 RepID=A0ABR1U9K2_9PEZI